MVPVQKHGAMQLHEAVPLQLGGMGVQPRSISKGPLTLRQYVPFGQGVVHGSSGGVHDAASVPAPPSLEPPESAPGASPPLSAGEPPLPPEPPWPLEPAWPVAPSWVEPSTPPSLALNSPPPQATTIEAPVTKNAKL